MTKTFLDYVYDNINLEESLSTQEEIKLFQSVLKARDIEVKFIASFSSNESVMKVRSKSVDKNKVFNLYVRDIQLTNISQSMNVDF
jgi:hypothetical protein